MVLIDSSVWIPYFKGTKIPQTLFLLENLHKNIFMMGDLIYMEVLQGFRSDNDYEIALNYFNLLPFECISSIDIALKSADNYRFLRKKGITIRKSIDILIGTFCIENKIQLLHNDKDFLSMESHLNLKTVPQ